MGPEKQQARIKMCWEAEVIMAWPVDDDHARRKAQPIQTSACRKLACQSFYVFSKEGWSSHYLSH